METVNLQWRQEAHDKISDYFNYHTDFEMTTDSEAAVIWLMIRLTKYRIPFRVTDFGSGVKKIATDLERCPMCGLSKRQKVKKKVEK